MTEDQLNALLADCDERDRKCREMGLEPYLTVRVRQLIATVTRLREAIWPGLPPWKPTEREPQQDFYEAFIESLRIGIVQLDAVTAERDKFKAAIAEHHAQKADDRCWLDDVKLHQAAGLPTGDNRVGDKPAMLRNCERFLERRCADGGPWVSYAELEAERDKLAAFKSYVHSRLDAAGVPADPDSPHRAEGCRVGGRLDVLVGERDELRGRVIVLEAVLDHFAAIARDNPEIEDRMTVRPTGYVPPPGDGVLEPTMATCREAARLLDGEAKS